MTPLSATPDEERIDALEKYIVRLDSERSVAIDKNIVLEMIVRDILNADTPALLERTIAVGKTMFETHVGDWRGPMPLPTVPTP